MNATVQQSDELFQSGPPLRLKQLLGFVKTGGASIARRAMMAVLISWVPLALMAAVRVFILREDEGRSFPSDVGVHARFLVAAPALILAEPDCLRRLERVVRHFRDSGLVTNTDRPRYDAAVTSSYKLLHSAVAEILIVVLAYALVAAFALNIMPSRFPLWRFSSVSGSYHLSPAGWWHVLVSVPLLNVLFLGWVWRLLLWTRFLWLMTRLDLRLISSHPDGVGGLKFVSTSLRGFRLIGFALGSIAAGMVAGQAIRLGTSPLEFQNLAIAVVAFTLLLSAGPLFVFVKKLRGLKSRGTYAYGLLASDVGRLFEQKWLERERGVEGSLEVPDFSATTDLYQVAGNVYQMRDLPFGLKNLMPIVVATMLPFIPVALMAVPAKKVLQLLEKLLL
jgi:hypothetical protein